MICVVHCVEWHAAFLGSMSRIPSGRGGGSSALAAGCYNNQRKCVILLDMHSVVKITCVMDRIKIYKYIFLQAPRNMQRAGSMGI